MQANSRFILFALILIFGTFVGIRSDHPGLAADGDFTLVGTGLEPVSNASLDWGDYDDDGVLDLVLSGCPAAGCSAMITRIYHADAPGSYTVSAVLPGLAWGSTSWGDYDADGDLDLAMTGCDEAPSGWCVGEAAYIYRNDGSNVWTDISAPLVGAVDGSVDWGDYDNDGDLDLLVTGADHDEEVSGTKLYRNEGSDSFVDAAIGLPRVSRSDAEWADYDNDGDLDIVLLGLHELSGTLPNPVTTAYTEIYRNDGGGVFTDIDAGLIELHTGSLDLGDYDQDGDLDLLATGINGTLGYGGSRVTKLYRNEGGGTFTDVSISVNNFSHSSTAWGDYDNDGDIDFVIIGYTSTPDARLYENEGGGSFSETFVGFDAAAYGEAKWADYDGDGDLDLLYNGCSGSPCTVAKTLLYRNDGNVGTPNNVPATPIANPAVVSGSEASLSWADSSDYETPSLALTYNVRVGTSPGAGDVRPPMAMSSNGMRHVVRRGSLNQDTDLTLNLPFGTYYWAVQAIDSVYTGSPFSTEGSFTILPSDVLYLPLIQR